MPPGRSTLGEVCIATDRWTPPHLGRKALLHVHCRQRAVLNPGAEGKLLTAMGLELIRNPADCCGVAGAFGYEANYYDTAMKIGEHDLLPLVRKRVPTC